MKKILSLLLICIMLSCSLAGCGTSDNIDSFIINRRAFSIIPGETNDESIVVDMQEKTQYLYLDPYGYGGGLTLLVDSEGKPILYEGEIPYYGGEVGN